MWPIRKPLTTRPKLGVGARLLFAFLGISGFAVLAAAAGIYAIRQVGAQLDKVDARVPLTLASLDLSASAERIIAAAPALLAATERQRRGEVTAQLAAEIARLNGRLRDLEAEGTQGSLLLEIGPFVSALTANIVELENAVARRSAINETVAALRRDVFQISAETQRLLAPTLKVADSRITELVEATRRPGTSSVEAGRQLAALIEQRQPTESAKELFAAAADMLVEASTADLLRLRVLVFQLGRAQRTLDATSARMDAKLRSLFEEQVEKLREFIEGPGAIATARTQELALIAEAERHVAENANLSAQLTAIVGRLAEAAKRDIGEATRDAVAVQGVSTRILVALVVLCLLTSALIVWLYVGRSIARRLTDLNDGMLAIADGNLQASVKVGGADEISAMGRAVEIFRRNTLERDALLAERAHTASRLEREVEARTAELAQSVAELRALGEVSQAVNSTIDLETVLATIVAKAVALSGTEAGSIYVFDAASRAFHLRSTYGMDESLISGVNVAPIRMGDSTVVDQATMQGVPVQIADILEDDASRVHAAVLRAGFRAVLAIPLLGADGIVGALVVRSRRPGEVPKATVELLQTFAAHSVLAIQNAGLFEEIRRKSGELEAAMLRIKALHNEMQALNLSLEAKVRSQVEELERFGRLRRFLAPQLAQAVVSAGGERILETHRREIVSLFCDLRGFTSFAETAEPEDIMALLAEYHGAVVPLIRKYEGTLDRFTGDGMMVFFNDPLPCPDAPQRAVRLAIEMRDAVTRLALGWAKRGHKMGCGIGVAQGYATLGRIGFEDRMDYTAIGTVINLAARLCAQAENGQVLTSGRLVAAVDGLADLEPLGEQMLRGMGRPVEIISLIGLR
jgi:class 3 adenylate cyclase/transcriptional regulator with GAF, ATPase, and Fis domain